MDAHIFLRRCLNSTDLERACDAVAAELLMPLDEVRASAGGDASVDTLRMLARRFEVSLHAMAVCINELKIWKHSIGLWRWDGGATELWFVGRRLWPTRTPYFNAFELAMQSQGAVKMSEMYMRMDGARFALIEVRRLGKDYLLAVISSL
jgi:Zn-dependent peptidase ImmA (M78 family)